MPPRRLFPFRCNRARGAALVIILAFIVLLTVLVIAFFSRVVSERQVSNSSASQAKVEILAQGAIDTIVGDLEQEIAAGSINTTISSGTTVHLSLPASPATVVPCIAVTGTGAPGVTSFAANLLKRSAYSQPFYSGSSYNLSNNTVTMGGTSTISYPAPNRAACLSTSGTSQNGRYISAARWNKPLFLPKVTPGSTTDFTPVATGSNAFVPPDWILVARDGSNPTVWNSNMVYSGSSQSSVIGRYAYAIYDEGGVLDMNVAGCPSTSGSDQYSTKGSLAWADLTAVGLTASQIDAIVGWRNYASAQPSGALADGFNFDASAAAKYYNAVSSNTKGFLVAGNRSLYSGQSDRMFSSRQALIKLLTQVAAKSGELAAAQNALQYLGTFSRDLEQPVYIPDPNIVNPSLAADPNAARPKNTRSPNTDTSSSKRDGGGNDAVDASTFKQYQDIINPSLLTAIDANAKPVLKRRFALCRLAWLTYKGPSGDNLADASVQQTIAAMGGDPSDTNDPVYQFVARGTKENIYSCFGLTWDGANARWIYYHEDAESSYSGGVPSRKILKLSEIAALPGTPREPDFFETLKAVINCDSLGKQHAGWDSNTSPHNIGGIDCSINYQIIQIGANLIDQFDSDSYPTRIAFDAPPAPGAIHMFCGVENLPYMAGWSSSWFRVKQLTSADILPDDPSHKTGSTSTPLVFQPPAGKGFPFETWVFYHPIIWNPHAPDSRTSPPNVPTAFRVVAGGGGNGTTAVKVHPWVAPPWWTKPDGTQLTLSGGQLKYPAAGLPNFTTSTFSDATIDPSFSIIAFNTATGAASFREPYCLRTQNFPENSHADISDAAGKPNTTGWYDTAILNADKPGGQMIGFFSGKCWTGPCAADPDAKLQTLKPPQSDLRAADPKNCLSSGATSFVSGGSNGLQFLLQYQAPGSSTWVTYDMINDVYISTLTTSSVDSDDTNTAVSRGFRTCFRTDPRTDRWGLAEMNTFPTGALPSSITSALSDGLNPSTPVVPWPQGTTLNPSSSFAYRMTASSSGITAPGWKWTPGTNLLPLDVSDLAVNIFDNTVNPNAGGTTSAIPGGKFYYTDPDGVIRRSGGAFFSGSDGLPLYTGNMNSRPVILNRPFRSIAEMGYAFSGTPWKNLDFFTPESGNAALLDAFCLNELENAPADVTVAGRVNLNTRQPKVLQALIQGVAKAEGGIIGNAEAAAAAQALVNWTSDTASGTSAAGGTKILNKGPLRNRSELVGKFVYQVPVPANAAKNISDQQSPILDGSKSYQGYSSVLTSGAGGVFSSSTDAAIKRRRECVMRALADSGNTRTWNLMIDVVSQVGRYPANAKSLDKFIVEGESRCWVHIAIDRYTGNIVEKIVEPVSE